MLGKAGRHAGKAGSHACAASNKHNRSREKLTCFLCGGAAGGKVNKVDADFIGLLVLGVFNAAIARQNIRPQYSFRAAVRARSAWLPAPAAAAMCT